MSEIYKVSCEFYVKADSKEEAIEGLIWETDFFNYHIVVEPSELPENEVLWEDYTEKEINEYRLCVSCQNSFHETELNSAGLCGGCQLQDRE